MSLYDTEKLFSNQKANLELLQKVSAQVFEGAEKLAALQLKTLRTSADEQFDTLRKLLAVRGVEGLTDLQGSLATPAAQLERLTEFNRQVYELVSGTQSSIAKLVEQQIETGNKHILDAVDEIARNAPAGSESVVAAFKSAVDSANTLYENSQKAARQAAKAAESGLAAASSAATQAAKAATKTA